MQVESRYQRLLRRQSTAFLLVAVLASALMALLGWVIKPTHPLLAEVLVLFGGSGMGACFGVTVASLGNASAVERVREIIEESLRSDFKVADADLAPYRKVWHHYLLTEVDGKYIWRYRTFDFSRVHVPGKLVAMFDVQSPDGRMQHYHIDAYVVAPRVLFIQKSATGTELPIVHIYPTATETFGSLHAGLACIKSWGGKELTVPVLMSEQPLKLGNGAFEEGTLPDATFRILDERWANEAPRSGLTIEVPKAGGA
jgi:hypothetical protein